MNTPDPDARPNAPDVVRPQPADSPPGAVPWGYRPGIITAITVFLAFSLAFLRYWGFEAPGRWHWYSVVSICVLAASVVLQIVALFRALRLEDIQPAVYRVTVRWFAVAVVVMVIGVLLAAFEVAVT